MRRLLIGIIVGSTIVSADLTTEQIEMMVKQIHQKRKGLNTIVFEQIKEPFVKRAESNTTTEIVPVAQEPEEKIELHAILNKKVFIGDRWYKEGDEVGGYRLVYVGKHGIVLKNKNNIKKVFLKKMKRGLIMTKERKD